MRMEFDDDDLEKLFVDPNFVHPRFGRDLVRAYRKKVTIILNAQDQRDLRMMKSLHLEKLSGDLKGKHSIRLNKQWRLILEFRESAGQPVTAVLKIDDYH